MTDSRSTIQAIAQWMIETSGSTEQYDLLTSCTTQYDRATGIVSIAIPPDKREAIIALSGFLARVYNAIDGCHWIELSCNGEIVSQFEVALLAYVQQQTELPDNKVQSEEQDFYP